MKRSAALLLLSLMACPALADDALANAVAVEGGATAVDGAAGADSLDAIRQQMLGLWICEQGDQRSIKQIGPEYETISLYVGQQLARKWRCRWDVELLSGYLLYKFRDFEFLVGPPWASPDYEGSYLLRLTENQWIEAVRMEQGAEGMPRVSVFQRAPGLGALEPTQAPPEATTTVATGEPSFFGRIINGMFSATTPEPAGVTNEQLRADPPARPWRGSDAEWFDPSASDQERAATLSKLAVGTWRHEKPDGTVIEKTVTPGVETVTLTRNGGFVRSWSAEWEIHVYGGVAQYRFRNYKLLDGERSAPDGLQGGYVLAITGDVWTEVAGLIGRAPNPPSETRFVRVKAE